MMMRRKIRIWGYEGGKGGGRGVKGGLALLRIGLALGLA